MDLDGLNPEQRDLLTQMLDAFEAALARQDPSEMENARSLLEKYLDAFEPEAEDDTWKKDHDDSA